VPNYGKVPSVAMLKKFHTKILDPDPAKLVHRFMVVKIFTKIRSAVLREIANRQTDIKQTQTDKRRVKHHLLGGDNNRRF